MNTKREISVENVFVDEAGATDLPSIGDTAPDYYVICGVLLANYNLGKAKKTAAQIVRKHAGTGELKSKKIGSNITRRKKVLTDIVKSDFPFYCLVINKERIWKDSGLRWRPSFYKFLHQMFYSQIRRAFFGIQVMADQYGRSEFMESFRKYIKNRASLFDSFNFAPSREVPLLQIADILAGSLRRVFLNEDPADILDLLGYPSVPIEEWPPMSSSLFKEWNNRSRDTNQLVASLALKSVRNFVENKIGSTDARLGLQAETIRYLLSRFNQNPEEYVHRAELIEHLHQQTGIMLNEQVLSSTILAVARDEGVFLSSTDKGVKIPYCEQDITDWIDRVNSQIVPYLRRIEDARRDLLIASHNQYDIVDPKVYPELSRYLKLAR